MPAVLALPAFWGAVSAGAAVSGGIIAGKMQSNASRDAANLQVGSINKAAELQKQSSDAALEFQKSQATEDARRFEQTQQANYNQWAAREGRMSDFGQALGLSARHIPQYQSSMPGGSPSGAADPKVAAFVADWQRTHPVSEGIGPVADALKKAGLSSGRFDYGGGNLSNNEVTVGGKPYKVLGGEGTPAAYWYVPGMNDSGGTVNAISGLSRVVGGTPAPAYASNFMNILTPALQTPRVNPFQ